MFKIETTLVRDVSYIFWGLAVEKMLFLAESCTLQTYAFILA
jgi:hypothetical protein